MIYTTASLTNFAFTHVTSDAILINHIQTAWTTFTRGVKIWVSRNSIHSICVSTIFVSATFPTSGCLRGNCWPLSVCTFRSSICCNNFFLWWCWWHWRHIGALSNRRWKFPKWKETGGQLTELNTGWTGLGQSALLCLHNNDNTSHINLLKLHPKLPQTIRWLTSKVDSISTNVMWAIRHTTIQNSTRVTAWHDKLSTKNCNAPAIKSCIWQTKMSGRSTNEQHNNDFLCYFRRCGMLQYKLVEVAVSHVKM